MLAEIAIRFRVEWLNSDLFVQVLLGLVDRGFGGNDTVEKENSLVKNKVWSASIHPLFRSIPFDRVNFFQIY